MMIWEKGIFSRKRKRERERERERVEHIERDVKNKDTRSCWCPRIGAPAARTTTPAVRPRPTRATPQRFALRSYLVVWSFSAFDVDDRKLKRLARSVVSQNTLDRRRQSPSQPLSKTNGIRNRGLSLDAGVGALLRLRAQLRAAAPAVARRDSGCARPPRARKPGARLQDATWETTQIRHALWTNTNTDSMDITSPYIVY